MDEQTTVQENLTIDEVDEKVYQWEIISHNYVREVIRIFRRGLKNPGRKYLITIPILTVYLALILFVFTFMTILFPTTNSLCFVFVEFLFGPTTAFVAAVALILLVSARITWNLTKRWQKGVQAGGLKGMKALTLGAMVGVIQYIITSPLPFIRSGFAGSTATFSDWIWFFSDEIINILYFGIPKYLFGSLSDITPTVWYTSLLIALYRTCIASGVIAGLYSTTSAMLKEKDIFYGTAKELFLHMADANAYARGPTGDVLVRRTGQFLPSSSIEVVSFGTLCQTFGKAIDPEKGHSTLK